jgi:hypothetical protein
VPSKLSPLSQSVRVKGGGGRRGLMETKGSSAYRTLLFTFFPLSQFLSLSLSRPCRLPRFPVSCLQSPVHCPLSMSPFSTPFLSSVYVPCLCMSPFTVPSCLLLPVPVPVSISLDLPVSIPLFVTAPCLHSTVPVRCLYPFVPCPLSPVPVLVLGPVSSPVSDPCPCPCSLSLCRTSLSLY